MQYEPHGILQLVEGARYVGELHKQEKLDWGRRLTAHDRRWGVVHDFNVMNAEWSLRIDEIYGGRRHQREA